MIKSNFNVTMWTLEYLWISFVDKYINNIFPFVDHLNIAATRSFWREKSGGRIKVHFWTINRNMPVISSFLNVVVNSHWYIFKILHDTEEPQMFLLTETENILSSNDILYFERGKIILNTFFRHYFWLHWKVLQVML